MLEGCLEGPDVSFGELVRLRRGEISLLLKGVPADAWRLHPWLLSFCGSSSDAVSDVPGLTIESMTLEPCWEDWYCQVSGWKLERVADTMGDVSSTLNLHIQILEADGSVSEEVLRGALRDRWVEDGALLMVRLEGYCCAGIRVRCTDLTAPLRLQSIDYDIDLEDHRPPKETGIHTDTCPGYEDLCQEILELVESPIQPTGIALVGPAGVGKTRLVRSLGLPLEWISVPMLLQTVTDLSLPTVIESTVIVLEELHVLANPDEDLEQRLVLAAIQRLWDRPHRCIIGLSRTVVPEGLSKAGRLEVQVTMPPPTEYQRRIILSSMKVPNAQRLASLTPGCLAGDLQRLCEDAETRHRPPTEADWLEAARACVPSELVLLDVRQPIDQGPVESVSDWYRVFEQSWGQLGGYDLVKKRIFRSVVLPWRRQLHRSDDPISPPSGVLFHGRSGTGKTMAASYLSSSLGLPMINVRATDVLDKWVGGSEAAVRSIFARARSAAPCILFLDEIDAIASNRATDGESTDVMSRLLSTLLNEMDGVDQKRHILVVACTNRPDSLDAALLRPGRLDEHIAMHSPSKSDVLQILQLYLARIALASDVDLNELARSLQGLTGASIEALVREAALLGLQRTDARVELQKEDFVRALGML